MHLIEAYINPVGKDSKVYTNPGCFGRELFGDAGTGKDVLARAVHAEFRVQRGVRAARDLLTAPPAADRARLREATELRHAGRWLVARPSSSGSTCPPAPTSPWFR